MIPEAAVEAALEVSLRQLGLWGKKLPEGLTEARRGSIRELLEAVAPHLMANRKPKPGEGDYLPGWDDRKTLAELWQQHAPLPEGGLRDGTYDALIAVATWGYQQRKDEEL